MASKAKATSEPDAKSRARGFREHWADEMDGAAMYRALASATGDGEQREIFLELSKAEERHARHWVDKLAELGEPAPDPATHRRGAKARLLIWLAGRFGASSVLPLVERAEIADAGHYDGVPDATVAMATDERIHARVLAGLTPATAKSGILRGERWHRGDASGAMRAAIFGVNDGLVSNLSLVMGVTGGEASRHFIVLAGLAGLLAGAFSMGAGEFISVTSQRELFQREIALESEEIEAMPDEEANELALIYRAKGIGKEEAEAMAARIMRDHASALDTMAREELGLNPDELGSPTKVAASSFASFASGALFPVLPWLFSAGTAAFVSSVLLSAVVLFVVGAGISLLTGRPLLRVGVRQLLVGGAAAAATFGIGRLIGVSVN
ncbi:MAG TPA: VIT1/CCC1 family protein [Actinomycetota bacterium]